MTGLEEFKDVFGSITVLNVVELLLAILFCYLIYRKVSKYLIERYEAGKKKDEQLKTALDQVSKYPEYRAQSLRVQKELQTEIDALHSAQSEQIERLIEIRKQMKLPGRHPGCSRCANRGTDKCRCLTPEQKASCAAKSAPTANPASNEAMIREITQKVLASLGK